MAAYPPVTAFDFEAHLENGILMQDLIPMPAYDFQHTAEFDYYRPTIHDYMPYPASGPDQVMLRADLAACLFETYNMKVKYVLAAAHDWNGELTTDPLPSVLPDSKLKEIGMPAPPFLDCQLWAVNFFFKPKKSLLTGLRCGRGNLLVCRLGFIRPGLEVSTSLTVLGSGLALHMTPPLMMSPTTPILMGKGPPSILKRWLSPILTMKTALRLL